MTPTQERTDPRQYLAALWRGKWAFLACVLVLPAAAYAFSVSLTKSYEATAIIQVDPEIVDTTLFNEGTPTATGTVEEAVGFITTTRVAEEAAEGLPDPPADPASLLDQIAVTGDETTSFIAIVATDGDPQRAADIANAFAETTIDRRSRTAVRRVNRTVAAIQRNLELLDEDDDEGREQLSEQLQRLRALRAAQGDNGSIVEPATIPDEAVSPTPVRNTILAAIVAVLLGFALVGLLDRLDRKVRKPAEIEELLDAPLLTIVPKSAFPGQASSPGVLEAFQTLRTSLTYFNVDRKISTVVVTSGLTGEGKTTVSAGLARAAARTGRTVIAVDCDLRKGRLGARMGIPPGPGLGDVLVGERSLDDVLVAPPGDHESLRVLPAGPTPPNPSELIGSQRMRDLLEELAQRADLVVIDTPPLLIVSDVIPLLESTSGSVLVGRIDDTTRDGLTRLRQILSTAGGTVLGVVVTGAAAGGLYEYDDGSYHGASTLQEGGDDEDLNVVPAANGKAGRRLTGRS